MLSEVGCLKRERFYAENPDILKMTEEIRRDNESPGDEFTLGKVEEIKRHAIENCPLYRGMSATEDFPVLTKADFIRNASLLKAKGGFSGPIHVSSTSGSTGTPFRVEQDRVKRRRTIADLKVFGEYALYPSHEKMLQLRSYNGRELDREVDRRENIWRWDVSSLGGDALDRIVGFIEDWHPSCVFGYTSTLEALANHLGPGGAPLLA